MDINFEGCKSVFYLLTLLFLEQNYANNLRSSEKYV